MKSHALIRIKALILKESRQMLRDPSSILIAFVLPAILLVLFGYGVNMDAQNISLGVAMESNDPASQRLVQTFQSTSYFDVEVARDRRELLGKITSGNLRGLVIIPQDFASRLASKDASPILVITDASETNTANFVRNYSAGVLRVWQMAEAREQGNETSARISLEPRFWYNAELETRNALIPGSLAIVMAIIGTLLTSLVVAREWERGTMEALLSTPVSPIEMLIAKTVPYLALGFLSLIGTVAVVIFLFEVPFRGGFPALMLAGGAFLLSALGQGLLISTITKNQFVASQGALITAFLPAFLLSGFIFEIASMPWLVRQITRIIPARYLVTNLKTLFLVGDVWAVLIPNVLFLLIIGALFFIITLRKSPRRLESD
ncbi:MAG TPA: ABC transporter permease [Desulfobacteraceae bacterium]|nr:ABC transporter permease [Desulfobacteraceae bacterium]HPJ66662.1 ABC transporter permease [Desulfobacteraceae bacterium]HPQ27781.1 ABC transporter permease [Desulfobacteraceae bacterium]